MQTPALFSLLMKTIKTMTGDSLEAIIDCKVVDDQGEPIGSLHSLWSDPATGRVEFLGVKTGWIFGHNHVVPADRAELDESQSTVRLPYPEAFIKEAPSISADAEISETQEAEINAYYRGKTTLADARAETPPAMAQPESGGDPVSGARALSDANAAADRQRWTRTRRPPAG